MITEPELHLDEPRRSALGHVVEEAADAAILVILAAGGTLFGALAGAARIILLVAEAALRALAGMPTPEDDPEIAQILAWRDTIAEALS